jgi:RimJ/RimL family protein N-acetyltransferase
MAWPRHRTVDVTRQFLRWSEEQWNAWPAGPYVIVDKASGRIIGGTGLMYDAPGVASVGYVLARDAWGRGYASEALGAMVELARMLRVHRFYALCHLDHRASHKVLETAGFRREPSDGDQLVFPNLSDEPQAVAVYVWPSGE